MMRLGLAERNRADAGESARWPYRRDVIRRSMLVAAIAALGGCAQMQMQTQEPSPPPSAPPPVNLSGYSAVFKEGFKDGCDTARGNARRNDARYKQEPQYAQGWQDGKSICSKR